MNLTEEEQEEKEKVWFSVETWQFSFRFHVIRVLFGRLYFILPSVALERRRTKFMHKLCCVDFFT